MGDDMETVNARASKSFRAFMALVAKFDELTEVGSRFLKVYQQELEVFRRPPLHKVSKVIERIIEANKTDRMIAYLDAGCKLTHSSLQNTGKLFSCQQGLQVHIEKAKHLMEEIEEATENAIGIFQDATESNKVPSSTCINDSLEKLKISADQEEAQEESFSFGEEDFAHDHLEGIVNLSIMTRTIGNMMKSEFIMQEKIVQSLNLNSSSEELDSYCMLWELRPYIDDQVMRQSWALVRCCSYL